MKPDLSITSRKNVRVKQTAALRSRRERDSSGRTVIEGTRELHRALRNGINIRELYVCPDLVDACSAEELAGTVPHECLVIEVTSPVFGKLSYRDKPEGVLGVADIPTWELDRITLPETPLVLVGAGIEKPGNIGAMLRVADAAGASAALFADSCTDLTNPNVIRASTGTVFSVQVGAGSGEDILLWLRQRGLSVVAAAPQTETLYTEMNMTVPVAIVVGKEATGLSPRWLKGAHHTVRIPMMGTADSLNAAVSASLLLYEALRQRGSGKRTDNPRARTCV